MIISRVEAERMLETQAGAYEAMANAWEQLKPAIIAEAGRRVDANAAKRINAAVPQLQINIEHEAIYNGKKTNIKAAFPYHDDVFKYLAGYNYTTDGDGNKRRFPKYSYVPNAGGYVVNHSIIRAAGDPFPVFSAELIDAICSVSEKWAEHYRDSAAELSAAIVDFDRRINAYNAAVEAFKNASDAIPIEIFDVMRTYNRAPATIEFGPYNVLF